MRSGCSLPATVLLLLFSGLAVWGARHWKPSIICDNSSLSWFCGGYANVAGGSSDVGDRKATGGREVATALPWPIADQPRSWSNFREGAYSIPAVAEVEETAPAPRSASTAISWPIAEAPRTWSNFRDGAYSIPAVAEVAGAGAVSKTVAHPFPWPIADAPRKWTNFRKAPKTKKIVAKKARSKTVAHPFPWPIADAPRKWTNFRAPSKQSQVAASSPVVQYSDGYVAHGPHPARNGLELLILRVAKSQVRAAGSPTVQYADNYASYGPHPARNGLELLVLRVKKSAMKKASDCGDELNQVARDGVILFETASAKLKDSSYETLDRLVGVAKTCDRVNIVVEGHTDDRGSASFNQRLSEQRARSVAAYLQGAGVGADNLSAVGYGESRPAVPNTSAANLAKNRRIEFSVSGN